MSIHGGIQSDFEAILDAMRTFAMTIEDFPVPRELREARGPGGSPDQQHVAGFHAQLAGLAEDLEFSGKAILKELEAVEQAVRATARQMAETDAVAADTANLLVEQLESVSHPHPATSVAPVQAPQPKVAAPRRTVG